MPQTKSARTPREQRQFNVYTRATARYTPSIDELCREWGEVLQAILTRRREEQRSEDS
ncbi:MAG: hypothetical protein O2909_12685 [Chloroflexi bacterium]|nr:hypothetical protein [Chloroflexota bacterium]